MEYPVILKIASGPLKGQQIVLKDQMMIGYKKGDFLVEDREVKSPHAQILKIGDKFSIQSVNDSKDNILCDEVPVSFLILEEGVSFQLGSTLFQVEDPTSSQDSLNIPLLFSQKLGKFSTSLEDELESINILKKTFQIRIEKGTQKGKVWNIGYLPRRIGFTDSHLLLLDSHFKDVYFDLILEKDQITFHTPYKEYVLFNHKHLQKTPVKDKDLIVVRSSYLRIQI